MAISKLIFNGVIQMDVTGTSAGTGDVASGETFILADGTEGTGTLTPITVNSLSVTSNGTYTAPTGTAYSPVTVNVSGGGGQYAWAGQNATLYSTVLSETYSLSQTGFASWTPSTTAADIIAAEALDPITVTNLTDYDYHLVYEYDFVAAYAAGATLKSQIVRDIYCSVMSVYSYSTTLVGITTPNTRGYSSQAYRNLTVYYNSSGNLTASASNYGIYSNSASVIQSVSGDNSSASIAATIPSVKAQCNNSYFSTARAVELDKDASKIKMKLYVIRCDRPSVNGFPGWNVANIYNNPL